MSVSKSKEADLAALVTARICHDLISPIGAVDNGIELIASLGVAPQPSDLALIAESARTATMKMKVFRLAFGAPKGSEVAADELERLVKATLARPRQTVEWAVADAPLPRLEAQLLLLLAMCCDTAMARGGTLRILRDAGRVEMTCTTERPRVDPDIWAHLSGDAADEMPAAGQIHFVFAAQVAAALGWTVSWSGSEMMVKIVARPD